MQFVWDEKKDRQNFAKHKVSFELATHVFDDPLQLTVPDPHEGEERWRTMGLANGVVILLVVHTIEEPEAEQEEDENEKIRIISARKATRAERQAYEDSH